MRTKTRLAARSTLGWAFGLAIPVLLLSIWGRAVVSDTDTLAESVSPLAETATVVDFVADWMAEEMVESGADPVMVGPTVDYFLGSSAIGQTLRQFGVEVVDSAASTDPAGSTIDMAAMVAPAVPEVATGLAGLGLEVTESSVHAVVEQLDPLVIRSPGSEALVGPASPAAARLGTAALLATLGLVVFGGGFVYLSEDRIAAVRSLMTRIAVGGLSFAVFLRLSSWVLDPNGGRAPVRESLSAVAESELAVPFQVGLVAALIAAGIYFGRRLIRRGEVFPSGDERSTPRRERSPSPAGPR